jgi:hypothetical protein
MSRSGAARKLVFGGPAFALRSTPKATALNYFNEENPHGDDVARRSDLRETANLLKQINLIWAVQSRLKKYFTSPVGQIISTSSRHPTPQEGRIAIVTNAGWVAVDAAASCARWDRRADREICERLPSERTRDVAAYGKIVWS